MSVLRHFRSRHFAAVSVLAMTVFLGSCELAKNQLTYDRPGELDRQDYRDALAPQPLPPEDFSSVPDFQPVVSTPEELRLPSPLVTVSVNQTVSLRDLMFELADQAGVDLELDPQIRGSIIFTAKERPFNEVVERICEMSGLRYKFQGNVLRIELDRPFIKTYSVDYLSVARSGSSEVSTEVSLGSGGGGDSGGGGATTSGGSSAEVTIEAEGDTWKELQENIEQILTSSDTHISLATLADPVSTPINTMPPPAPQLDANGNPLPPTAGQMGQMPAAMPPTLSVAAVAGEPLVPNPPATYSLSKQSGTITVFASERQQKLVEKFLNEFRRRVTTQVVIEAKVLQVDLTDEYATGIDWEEMNLTGLLHVDPTFASQGLVPEAAGSFTALLEAGDNINAVIQAVSRFGTVRALSSPRVTVLNNQPALVNVAQNNVYFTYDVETEEDSDTNETTITIDSEQQSTPEGVILSVVPSANPDTGEIMLAVRPTVSRITSTVADPTIAFSLSAIGVDPTTAGVPNNNIPEVSVQEMDSVVRMQSGQVMVMGGLMKDGNNVQQEGVPILADLPLIGNAFRNHSDRVEKSELLILIKARVVAGSNVDDTDRKIYNKFGYDRRPDRI